MCQHTQDVEKPPAAKDDTPADTNKEEATAAKTDSAAKTEPGGDTTDAAKGAVTEAEKDEVVVDIENPVVSAEAMDLDVKPVCHACAVAQLRVLVAASS